MILPLKTRNIRPALIALGAGLCALPGVARSQQGVHPSPPPVARATQVEGAIALDGILSERTWAIAQAARDFTQSAPDEGRAATQSTTVAFAYDDEALYVGARMNDTGPVTSRLTRRDQIREGDTDFLSLVFDTFHDHLGRATFTVNPAGVKQDILAAGGSSGDATWDPVWEVATSVDSGGWTAEIRIPFNQLRFSSMKSQTWGIQIVRFVNRLNERTHFAFWRANEGGGPSRYGHLEGINVERRPRRAELMPYLVGRSSHVLPVSLDNPFTKKHRSDVRAGADLKYLLTSNLALDVTVNPDFGQVEVDPAVVNLSAFETFYPEKRPFFIEGAGLFSFGSFTCFFCSDVSSLDLFYSRRIGRPPQGTATGTYVSVPENSTILAAAKVTGRTHNGFSVGVLDAVTRSERADVLTTGPAGERVESTAEVEPRTNYFVGRLKKDFLQGNAVIGGMLTSTLRDLDDAALRARLPRRAESLGGDWNVTWGSKTYSWVGSAALSSVSGDPLAIFRLQRSSARYFQRPDRKGSEALFLQPLELVVRDMDGHAGYTRVAKDNGNWLWESAVNYRSPGFEVNDIAFQTKADNIWANFNAGRQFTTVTRWYRYFLVGFGAQRQRNFDGDVTDKQMQLIGRAVTPNFWSYTWSIVRRPEAFDDRLARGGPVYRRVGDLTFNLGWSTDRRKTLSFSGNPQYRIFENGMRGVVFNVDATAKPAPNVLLSAGPRYVRAPNPHQYISAHPSLGAPFGTEYRFAELMLRTWSMDTRLNVTMRPTMSVELYAQPFISAAEYGRFVSFAAPRESKRTFGPETIPASQDFNLRSLRGNAVFRWEYRPGSTMFLVWQQTRSDREAVGDFDFTRDHGALFGTHPNNIFLLKLSYWLGM